MQNMSNAVAPDGGGTAEFAKTWPSDFSDSYQYVTIILCSKELHLCR